MSNVPCVLKCKNWELKAAGLGGAAGEGPQHALHAEIPPEVGVSELSFGLGCLFLLTLETGESLTGTRTAQNTSIGDGHKHLDESFGSL